MFDLHEGIGQGRKRRRWTRILAPTPVAIMLIAGTAFAALSLSYNTPSTQTLGVAPPPVAFVTGADASDSDYVSAFTLSTNKTYFTVTMNGVPEAQVTVGELFKIKNQDDAAHTVSVSTSQVSNAKVLAYKIEFYNGATLVSTLDLTAASPSADLGSMAAGAEYTAKAIVKLDSGAGNDNVAETSSLSLTVSA